jgi:sigma54-dependent transcription regulator
MLTAHGKPRNVIMSAEEFVRLKRAAGEPVPAEAEPRRARTIRAPDDPLGYDTRDYETAVARMIDDVRSGRTKPAVQEELARVRAAWSRGGP